MQKPVKILFKNYKDYYINDTDNAICTHSELASFYKINEDNYIHFTYNPNKQPLYFDTFLGMTISGYNPHCSEECKNMQEKINNLSDLDIVKLKNICEVRDKFKAVWDNKILLSIASKKSGRIL